MSVDWPLWLHAVVWTVVILGLSLGMLRPAKAYLMALQFRHRSSEYDLPDLPGDPSPKTPPNPRD
jgi:uncharacterized protein (DUF983 family)